MLIAGWDIQKIGIWLLLPAFTIMAIILPAFSPPGTPAETFALTISLILISIIASTTQHRAFIRYHHPISPRSPPAF
jgi:hypothetical protein